MITKREQQMIALHEQGKSAAEIAEVMGITPDSARRTISWLCCNVGPDTRHEQAMAMGSRALLAAIERALKGPTADEPDEEADGYAAEMAYCNSRFVQALQSAQAA